MAINLGINGFGRIGRLVFRAAMQQGGFRAIALNDLTDAKTLAHLLKYDSIHGRYPGSVEARPNAIVVDGQEIKILSERNPENLPWGELGVDLVLESTGFFTDREKAAAHLKGGAKRVLISAPAKCEATVVMGVNHDTLRADHRVISNASCTTNCLAPMVKVLHDRFGIVKGLMTTVHSYTNDQRILDFPHSDLRRARAAGISMIPTKTGAAEAVGRVIPELNGRLTGMAVRVPTPNGSLTDFVAQLKREVTKEEVNAAFREAAAGPLRGILEYCDEPIVMADIIGNPASCIFDSLETIVIGGDAPGRGDMVKVLGWYDNEWGYSHRCVDVLRLMMEG